MTSRTDKGERRNLYTLTRQGRSRIAAVHCYQRVASKSSSSSSTATIFPCRHGHSQPFGWCLQTARWHAPGKTGSVSAVASRAWWCSAGEYCTYCTGTYGWITHEPTPGSCWGEGDPFEEARHDMYSSGGGHGCMYLYMHSVFRTRIIESLSQVVRSRCNVPREQIDGY